MARQRTSATARPSFIDRTESRILAKSGKESLPRGINSSNVRAPPVWTHSHIGEGFPGSRCDREPTLPKPKTHEMAGVVCPDRETSELDKKQAADRSPAPAGLRLAPNCTSRGRNRHLAEVPPGWEISSRSSPSGLQVLFSLWSAIDGLTWPKDQAESHTDRPARARRKKRVGLASKARARELKS